MNYNKLGIHETNEECVFIYFWLCHKRKKTKIQIPIVSNNRSFKLVICATSTNAAYQIVKRDRIVIHKLSNCQSRTIDKALLYKCSSIVKSVK